MSNNIESFKDMIIFELNENDISVGMYSENKDMDIIDCCHNKVHFRILMRFNEDDMNVNKISVSRYLNGKLDNGVCVETLDDLIYTIHEIAELMGRGEY